MTDTDFLPDDYESPASGSGYMKLLQGENRIRILGKPLLGWEGWKEKVPFRFPLQNKPVATDYEGQKIKHFWAFVCWDYADESVKICEITQSSIQKSIESLAKDSDWGSPFGYDLKIVRRGDGLDTEYSVNPVPHSNVTAEMKEELIKRPVRLNALFENEDPFDIKEGAETDDLPF